MLLRLLKNMKIKQKSYNNSRAENNKQKNQNLNNLHGEEQPQPIKDTNKLKASHNLDRKVLVT